MPASGESDFRFRISGFLRASDFDLRISTLASASGREGPYMRDEKTVQRFIELRSQGWTCTRLMSLVHDWQA
jgi:hypothetical protein